MNQLERVQELTSWVFLTIFGKEITILVKYDKKYDEVIEIEEPRVYIQLEYSSPNTKNLSEILTHRGRKWYLSEYMTDDEIVKTCYLAFRTCVEHEVLEGFRVEGVPIFNPHVDYKELVKIADKEVTRNNNK